MNQDTIEKVDRRKFKKCEFCNKRKADVGLNVDPYAHELYDDETEYLICSECYGDRKDDI